MVASIWRTMWTLTGLRTAMALFADGMAVSCIPNRCRTRWQEFPLARPHPNTTETSIDMGFPEHGVSVHQGI